MERKNLEERFADFLKRWPAIHKFYMDHEEILTYLVVGGMTTVVAWSCKFLANILLYRGAVEHNTIETTVLTLVDWIAGVLFSFFANRAWVFKSKEPILQEAGKFVASRISTFFLEYLSMMIMDTWLHINFYVSTIVTAVIVVIANYIFSKFIVFRKTGESGDIHNQ